MLFDSFDFAIFLPLVFMGYWLLSRKDIRIQNLFILAASYVFYGWWDERFLALIAISTLVDFWVGRSLYTVSSSKKRKTLLWTSIGVNLGLLFFFKYSNFFIESFTDTFTFFGYAIGWSGLDIVLPVGISFYTFQTMSYTIDIYRGKITPTKDLIAFSAFVSFFPQLVAGPIERATNLLPQFYKKRKFTESQAVDGLRQILWGLFKKMVIADNCAVFVNQVFDNYADYSGSTLLLASCFFFIQVYGDFSGYSDIAIGTGKLFGFSLTRNFAFPFFATQITEFWQRWHISLTTWCRDYIYIPLGGNRKGKWRQFFNTVATFSIMGLWHGAQWTYVIWGVLNALYFFPSMFLYKTISRFTPKIIQQTALSNVLGMINVFLAVAISLVFFRSPDLKSALLYFQGIFSSSLLDIPQLPETEVLGLLTAFFVVEWLQRNKQHTLEFDKGQQSTLLRWGAYLLIAFLINWYGYIPKEFIYFQF
ncbi:MAG: MBOAT family O-acyltransferase [Cytophagales bacterium]|nr:MBOAT family O-acyltransferase [Cytophagales bacterium]